MNLRDYNGHTPTDNPRMAVRDHGRTALLAQAPAFHGQAELVGGNITWPRPLGTMSDGESLLWQFVAYVNGYEEMPDRDDERWGHVDADNLDHIWAALAAPAVSA